MVSDAELLIDDAICRYWDEVSIADDRLLTVFREVIKEACPTLQFRAESDEDGLIAGCQYSIALEHSWIDRPREPWLAALIWVEVHNVDLPEQTPIELEHEALLDHLGLLTEIKGWPDKNLVNGGRD